MKSRNRREEDKKMNNFLTHSESTLGVGGRLWLHITHMYETCSPFYWLIDVPKTICFFFLQTSQVKGENKIIWIKKNIITSNNLKSQSLIFSFFRKENNFRFPMTNNLFFYSSFDWHASISVVNFLLGIICNSVEMLLWFILTYWRLFFFSSNLWC